MSNAAWHADPYPFYAALRAQHREHGLFFDAGLRSWVACSAAAVNAVLQSPELVVRPPAEPVPAPLQGRPSGRVFGGLMRMNEGEALHRQPKAEAAAQLARLHAALPDAAAQVADAGFEPARQPIDALLFDAPLAVLAALLGVAPERWGSTAAQVRQLVAAWSPLADEAARSAGDAAAEALLQAFEERINRIGFFTQTCDATAGLLGNALVAWQLAPASVPDLAWLRQVARRDPAVQNTRRWAAAPLRVAGQALDAGDAVLVLLASAEHDAAEQGAGQAEAPFGWGRGRHACPGEPLSQAIAATLLQEWQHRAPEALRAQTRRWRYRPSPNARIPQFEPGAAT